MAKRITSDSEKERYNLNRREKNRKIRELKESMMPPKEVIPEGYRRCTKCKTMKLETTEYFSRMNDSFQTQCKECRNQYHADNREAHNKRCTENYRANHPKGEAAEILPDGLKRCCVCEEVKLNTSEYFGKLKKSKDGLKYECKQCKKAYYKDNREATIIRSHKYYEDNKENILVKQRAYNLTRVDESREYAQKYYENKSDDIKVRIRNYNRERARRDINFRLLVRYRTRVYKAVKGTDKSKTTKELIGCTIDELKSHLEQKFKDGMTFENYGEWHVDHIRPCASFDFSNESEQLECFNYTNLQPLWAEENMKKHDKY